MISHLAIKLEWRGENRRGGRGGRWGREREERGGERTREEEGEKQS